MTQKLTKARIDRFTYEGTTPRRDVRWDTETRGFGLRIYPSGEKSFVVSYRFKGRKRLFTIGSYGKYTLEQARTKAKKYLVGIDDGNDPLEARQRETQGETVKDLCDAYMERHAKQKKKSWHIDQQYINNFILPAWGNRKASSIKRSDAANLHTKIGQSLGRSGKPRTHTANRVLEVVSKMFERAESWGFVNEGFTNPASGIEAFKEVSRDRYVTHEELPKLAEAIDRESNLYARFALWMYLLTGLRRNELLASKWADIDWERKELKIRETKTGNPHYAPLSEPAIALLREIPHMEENPNIFPGRKEKQHLVNIDKAWRRVKSDAGVEDVRIHDLRRTVGSWMAQSGNSLHLIGRVLNHTNPKTTAVYARFGQDHVREALEQHGKQIMGVAKGNKAEVVAVNGKKPA